jgi:hypothetical protein
MDSSQTPLSKPAFDGYYAQLQTAALKATKHAAGLPADLAFHRSVDSDLAKDLETCSKKVVSMSNVLLDLMSTIGNSKSAKGKGKARLQDEDDFLDRFEALVVEPMDQLLERAVRSISHPFCLSLTSPRISLWTNSLAGRKRLPLPSNPQSQKRRRRRQNARRLSYNMYRISQNRKSSSSGGPISQMAPRGFLPCDISSMPKFH